MTNITLAAASALAILSAAPADFVGIAVNEQEINGNCVVDVYATYTGPADRLIVIGDVNASIEGGFGSLLHDDLFGGSWAPQLTIDADLDSFCLIGGDADFFNVTLAGSWGSQGFNQVDIPPGATWLNFTNQFQGDAQLVNLSNLQGQVTWNGYGTRAMRLVFASPPPSGKLFTFSGTAISTFGTGTPGYQDSFSFSAALCAVPSPSALVLLCTAGVVGRRARRV